MKRLSLSRAWDDSRQAVGRDGRLMAIVALALIALPGTVQALVTPNAPAGQLPAPGLWIVVALMATLLGVVGQLAILRLVAVRGTSVGEAIQHGVRRLLTFLAAVLIWLLPLALLMVLLGESMGGGPPSAPIAIGVIILFCAIVFALIRMLLLPAIISAEPVGPIAAIRRSWTLTSGSWWRLFAFLLLFLIAALCVLLAVELVIGSVVTAAFGANEPMSLTRLLIALATQAVTAVFLVFYLAMVGKMYAQLAAPTGAEVGVPNTGT